MSYRTFGLSLLLLIGGIVQAHASEPIAHVDIPAQPLGNALRQFADQAGLQLAVETSMTVGKSAPAVKGELSNQDALEQLLAGSGLKYKFLDGHTVAISQGAKEDDLKKTSAVAPSENLRLAQSASPRAAENPADPPSLRSEDDKVSEIIVTAQKRSQRLEDVPIPVAVVNAESLTENGQLRLQDYYNRIPGLSLSLTGDSGEPAPAIRGIATGGNTSPVVGLVIDEVPYGATVGGGRSLSAPDIDPGDVERIEVLRGPQGALYGASSIGGLIKYVTIDPSTDAVSGRVQTGLTSTSHGDDVGYSLRGAVNLPVSDSFAVRASGFTVREPGYIDNIRDGKEDINSRDSSGGRLTALWRPAEDFSMKFSAFIQRSERNGLGDVDISLGGLRQNSIPHSGLYDRNSQALSLTMTGRFGAVDLLSATGYSVDKIDSKLDNSRSLVATLQARGFTLNGLTQPLKRRIDNLTQEIRASIPLGSKVDWLTGVFFTDENVDFNYTYLATDAATGAPGAPLMVRDGPATYREYAAFTNLTFDITERFDVQVGGRVSHNKQTFSEVRTGAIAGIFFPGGNITEKVSSETPITYLLTPRFRISPGLMAYVRVASGYRPGGPNTGCGLAAVIPCQYEADKTRNYEIGLKGSALERRLSFDASVYHIDWKDIQLTTFAGAPVNFTYVSNLSRAKSQGIELSVEAHPWTGMTLSGWVAWDNAELTESAPLSATLRALRGDRLPFSSPFSGSFSLDQEFPLGSVLRGALGGSATWVDDRKGGFRSTALREIFPSYTQVDLRAGLKYDTWAVNLFVSNLTDERGMLNGGGDSTTPATNNTYFTYIQPRTIGISASKTF